MAQFTTGDAGPYGKPERTVAVPVVVDPVDELNAAVRALLRVGEAAAAAGQDMTEFTTELAVLNERWRALQRRVQQIFMLLAIAGRVGQSKEQS